MIQEDTMLYIAYFIKFVDLHVCDFYANSFVIMLNVIYDSMRGQFLSLQQHIDHDHTSKSCIS